MGFLSKVKSVLSSPSIIEKAADAVDGNNPFYYIAVGKG